MTDRQLRDVDGVLLDLDGVLTTSGRPLQGAQDAIVWLREAEVPFKILTNTTSLTQGDLQAELRTAGFDLRDDEVMTAATAAGAFLRKHHPGAGCFLVTDADLSEEFKGIEMTDRNADVVVIGGADDGFTYANLNRVFQMVMNGAAFIAMHRNFYWQTDEGLMLDAGAFVSGLEEATGKEATLVGKPARSFFETAAEALGLTADRMIMVGDNVSSDVNGAQKAGLRGVLVRTGAFRPEQLERAEREPDAIIDSIADLPDLIS